MTVTASDFHNRNWAVIDKLIEEQNQRLPKGWDWQCGGCCARLYQMEEGSPVLTAWAHQDGMATTSPTGYYPVTLNVESLSLDKGDFESALKFLTDAAIEAVAACGGDSDD